MSFNNMQRLFTIKEKTTTNTDGSLSESYATTATIWGSLRQLSARELFHAGGINSQAKYQIVTRKQTLTDEDQLVHDSKTYAIDSIDDTADDRMVINAYEI